MATVAQVNAVKALHETDDRTLNGVEYSAEEPYDIGTAGLGDPYEALHANNKLNTPVSVLITGDVDIAENDGTAQLIGTVTLWSTITNTDVTWTVDDAVNATVDQTGLVTAIGGNVTVNVTATSIVDGTLSDVQAVVITNQV